MLTGVFGSNRPIVLFTLLLPAIAVAALALRYASATPAHLAGPAYDLLFEPINRMPWLSVSLGLLVLFTGALLLNSIFNEHEFADKENHLPALVYFGFGISSLTWVYFNPIFLANVFLLLAVRRLFRIYRIGNATGMLYDAGFFMAMAILVYPPLALCIPFLWVGMVQLRSATFREWLVPALGLATIGLYIAAAYWWYGVVPSLEEFTDFGGRFSFGADLDAAGGHWLLWLLAGTLLVVVPGMAIFVVGMASSTVHRKNTKRAFLWLSVFLVAVFIYTAFLRRPDLAISGLLAVPIAVFASRIFAAEKRKALVSLIFYVWLVLVIVRMLNTGFW
jgi:hypothetical protein